MKVKTQRRRQSQADSEENWGRLDRPAQFAVVIESAVQFVWRECHAYQYSCRPDRDCNARRKLDHRWLAKGAVVVAVRVAQA